MTLEARARPSCRGKADDQRRRVTILQYFMGIVLGEGTLIDAPERP